MNVFSWQRSKEIKIETKGKKFVYIHCANVDGGLDPPFLFGKIPKIHSKPFFSANYFDFVLISIIVYICK